MGAASITKATIRTGPPQREQITGTEYSDSGEQDGPEDTWEGCERAVAAVSAGSGAGSVSTCARAATAARRGALGAKTP